MSSHTRPGSGSRVGRGGAAALLFALIGTLLLGALPAATPARADTVTSSLPTPRGIDRVCPPPTEGGPSAQAPPFTDLDTVHARAIGCAAAYGLIGGYPDGSFRPDEPVTRGQLATVVAGWLETATDRRLPVPDTDPFTDLDTTVHAPAIAVLAGIGVIGGRADGSYGPAATVTRGQLARVLTNAISYADVFSVGGPLPPPAPDLVPDDVRGTTFEVEVGALVGAGIAVGAADGTFGPAEQVTRGQLATFLMRAADHLDRYGRWWPTADTVVLVARLTAVTDPAPDPSVPSASAARGHAVLAVNAFNGTLAYALDLSDQPGPFAQGVGAVLLVSVAGEPDPVALRLLDGPSLDAEVARRDQGGVVTGVVLEADSRFRFADLVADPDRALVVVGTDAQPNGALTGVPVRP